MLNELTEPHVHSEQVSLIQKESAMVLLGTIATSFFYSIVLYQHVDIVFLTIWQLSVIAIYVARYTVVRFNLFAGTDEQLKSFNWERNYAIATLFVGLVWGVGSFYLMPVDKPLIQAVIVMTIGGLAAAAAVTYAPSKIILPCFTIPGLLPLSIFFFSQQGQAYIYMGLLVLIFLTVLTISHRHMYESTRRAILLGITNEDLIKDLKESNENARKLNTDLENKILKIEDMAEEMSYRASHDVLTGLINRGEFESILAAEIENVKVNGKSHALLYMDLDEFKVVNDTCGHIAGDELLKNLARHLADKIRSTDTLARLGGDEFGLLLPMCSISKAREIADNLRQLIKSFQFAWEEHVFDIGVSIGLVEINDKTGTLTDALKAADSACYVAKDLGRNRIHIYEENDLELSQRLGHMEWAQKIQKALASDSFELYAQEIKPLNNEVEFGWHGEVLLRMKGVNGDIIFPGEFIPAAERYHLMSDIDKWVIKNAMNFIRKMEEKYGSILCTINLSGQSICDIHFLEYIIEKIEEARVLPQSICFEITETAAVTNFYYAERLMAMLKKRGCSFALDDFGSGLSSYGYLKRLNVDYLKIDGSFVKSMLDDEKDHAIVKSINQVGKDMGMQTIAEFVENETLKNKLAELGVDFVQGYGIRKPEPIESVL